MLQVNGTIAQTINNAVVNDCVGLISITNSQAESSTTPDFTGSTQSNCVTLNPSWLGVDNKINQTGQAALKGQGWNNTDIASWLYAPIDGSNPVDIVISDTLRQVSLDSITIEFISALDLKGTTTQPVNSYLSIQAITALALGNTVRQPSADRFGLADISELTLSDTITQPMLDGITITAIKELALSSTEREPSADTITPDNVSVASIRGTLRQPTVDTLSIELYTELSFASNLVQISADTITLTSKTLPQFGKNDILMIDNSVDYLLTDNSIEYKAK